MTLRDIARHTRGLSLGLCLAILMPLAGCAATSGAGSTANTAGQTSPTPSATPIPACVQLNSGATPFTSLTGVSGFTLPAGAYISSGAASGGGDGEYQVTTYTVCFQGSEGAIDGPSGSTIAQLKQAGWSVNNLFPDPTSNAYLDYCSNSHNCVNDAGTPKPFTFVGFDQYVTHTNGYTTFRLQVATIAAPACLNDPQYYSGAPKYTIYYDGNSASSSGDPRNHFQMPPGTRVSTFQGGGTAGSTYIYFCSAGSQATVVNFLVQSMSNDGWTISAAASAGFTATIGTGPTYTIDVRVQNPNNYYLRVYVPM